MMYTIEKRRLIYIMTHKPTWWHTHCLTPGNQLPLWRDPFWVIGNCELCKMTISEQDWYSNTSQRRFYDDIDLYKKYWY